MLSRLLKFPHILAMKMVWIQSILALSLQAKLVFKRLALWNLQKEPSHPSIVLQHSNRCWLSKLLKSFKKQQVFRQNQELQYSELELIRQLSFWFQYTLFSYLLLRIFQHLWRRLVKSKNNAVTLLGLYPCWTEAVFLHIFKVLNLH